MRSLALNWYRLSWPREVDAEQVVQLCRLLATIAGTPVVIEIVGSVDGVEHRLALPSGRAETVVEQLRATIAGLGVENVSERPAVAALRAVELRLSSQRRTLRTDDPAGTGRALLTALAHVRRGEHLTLQWVLGRSLAPLAVPNRLETVNTESWLGAFLRAPFGPSQPVDPELRNALRLKQCEPGWRAVGRIAVAASNKSRQRQLVRQLVGALRSVEAPGVSLSVQPSDPSRVSRAAVGWRWPLRLNAAELATVAAFPIGATKELPVAVIGSRLLAPAKAISSTGRVIGEASFPGRERPVAISANDGLRHLHCLGPTGVGKSTLLLNLISQDMAAGRGVVVVEPKGDLIADVLARIPSERLADVVVLDPSDEQRPVGLNPLAAGGRSAELVADQLLGTFHSLYAAHWGPRTHDIFGASATDDLSPRRRGSEVLV